MEQNWGRMQETEWINQTVQGIIDKGGDTTDAVNMKCVRL
jgi:hypothetical protein